MKIRLILAFLLLACFISACKKTPNSATTTTATPAPATTPEITAQGGNTPLPETKYFKGSIGSSLDLEMKLVRNADQITGSYYYQRVGTRINLRGTIDKEGKFVLDEFDQAGKQTGTFKGLWAIDAQDGLGRLAGFWSKANQKNEKDAQAFSLHEEPIALTGDVELSAKQIKESNKKLKYEIAAQYPQFSGGSNPNLEKFNQAVRGVVTRKIAEFKKQVVAQQGVESVPDVAPEATPEATPEAAGGSDFTLTYEIALAQDDLISVAFDASEFYQGAAHPNSYSEVVNYDLKNGRQLKLSDLFKPGSKYLQALSSYAIADLKKQSKGKGDVLLETDIQSGAGPKAENYDKWTITKKGIGINFDAYQVGPYAVGPWSVIVPYANLKDLINPDGPIAWFSK